MKFFFLLWSFVIVINGYSQQKNYSFVFLNKKKSADELPKEEVEKIMKGHMANMERLAKEKKLIAAGPFDGGGGIFIFNTTSTAEAQEWLSTDPGVQAKRWDIEILPYTPRVGDVCETHEPYEMVSYHFIRFIGIAGSVNQKTSEVLKQHDEFLKSFSGDANVVTEGIFSPAGSILILKGDLNESLVQSSPATKQGLVTVDIKKLWIARGAFCEK